MERELISQNDDYYSADSFVEYNLTPGTYFVGVSASGNDDYNPDIIDSGLFGRTWGNYNLRLNFRPAVNSSIVDETGTGLDGDGDGVAGGAYNYWFRAQPQNRTISITGNDTTFRDALDVVTITNTNGVIRKFEINKAGGVSGSNIAVTVNAGDNNTAIATALTNAINGAFPGMAVRTGASISLTGERSIALSSGMVGLDITGRTIFVDRIAPTAADGTLDHPFNNLANASTVNAIANTQPGDIVRIIGNGGVDGDMSTTDDNFAYEIGFGGPLNTTLRDGSTLEIPRGVTAMFDQGAIVKLRQARIVTGSSTASVNRSGSSLQVVGTPTHNVIFTSYNNESVGGDTNPIPTSPSSGDWGGLSFRGDVDKSQGRFRYEDEGIFLNYVNNAQISYGGGLVFVDSSLQSINPVDIVGDRPTITSNTITASSDAAIAADPNSFEETNFNVPRYQLSGAYTSDYDRVGPEIRNNLVVGNSNNGLFVRIPTQTGNQLQPLSVAARFDDTDITHILSQNLVIQGTPTGPISDATQPAIGLVTFSAQAGGTLAAGTYNYRFTFVDANGYESSPSVVSANAVITGTPGQGTIRLNNMPPVVSGYVARKLYRSNSAGAGPYTLVTQLDGSATSYFDTGKTAGGTLPVTGTHNRARPDARLAIDPGTVVKLESSRIEVGFGAQLIAEGTEGQQVIFTTRIDDRYGAGGTFDTNNDNSLSATEAVPNLLDGGDWGGIYVGHTASASIDHALISYAGGITPIEGDFTGFNPVEVHQGQLRIRNSVLENNAGGTGGTAPGDRLGRLSHTSATIFVRSSQPVIVDNIIRNNVGPAISINANALDTTDVVDAGRQTGPLDRVAEFGDNQGPLVRRNRLSNDTSQPILSNGFNGMVVRGEILDIESVWDDTDIVHILQSTVTVVNFHTSAGLRLQSSPTESLVIKLLGAGAGFTAGGNQLDIIDRIGGMLHVVGQPSFPVILTSLLDDTVGAGFQPDGLPQTDTNSNGSNTVASPGNWRSILLDQFAHDRNVEVVLEAESAEQAAPGINFTPSTAQYLGVLAPEEKSGDELVRLGFNINGYINEPGDVDVYSFSAQCRDGSLVRCRLDNSDFGHGHRAG